MGVALQNRYLFRNYTHIPMKLDNTLPSIHPLGPYSVQSIRTAEAVSWAIGQNSG